MWDYSRKRRAETKTDPDDDDDAILSFMCVGQTSSSLAASCFAISRLSAHNKHFQVCIAYGAGKSIDGRALACLPVREQRFTHLDTFHSSDQ